MEKLDTPAQRLRWARIHKGKFESATAAAQAHGWTVPTYLGHENGDRTPSRDAAQRYAAAFGVPWAWIFDGGPLPGKPRTVAARDGGPATITETPLRRQSENDPMVPVRSFVGAGDEIFPLDGDGPIDWVPAPPGMEAAEATEVRGNSMRPLYHDGDLLFHSRRDTQFAEYEGEPVVVQISGGKRLVKILETGSRRGRYTLASVNPAFDPIEDQQLEWIGPIEWVHKRWKRGRRRRGASGRAK
jgi:phage repressor protein C with HTH and peptisase S24 domain